MLGSLCGEWRVGIGEGGKPLKEDCFGEVESLLESGCQVLLDAKMFLPGYITDI